MIGRVRIRLGGALLVLGARIHVALVDLAYAVAPGLISDDTSGRRVRPWWGLFVIALLVLGLAAASDIGVTSIRATFPHREDRP